MLTKLCALNPKMTIETVSGGVILEISRFEHVLLSNITNIRHTHKDPSLVPDFGKYIHEFYMIIKDLHTRMLLTVKDIK